MSERMTPEEIARQAAEALVEVKESALNWYMIYVSPAVHTPPLRDPEGTRARAERCVEHLRDGILAAVERALREVPVPPGVSDERMTRIEEAVASGLEPGGDNRWIEEQELLDDLLAEVRHLRAMMRSPEGEAIAEAYRRGKRDAGGIP